MPHLQHFEETTTNRIPFFPTQMSHQAAVSCKHYVCVAGIEDAATAFKELEALQEQWQQQ